MCRFHESGGIAERLKIPGVSTYCYSGCNPYVVQYKHPCLYRYLSVRLSQIAHHKNRTHKVPLVHFLRRNSTHEDANPQKRRPPWQSRTLGLAAWLWYQQPPAPGYLTAMGCTTRQTKDFIQRLKPAKEIINLISHLFYIILPPLPTRPPPERSNTAPPAFPAGRASSPIPSPSPPPLIWLVVVFHCRLAAA
jgi:hypothetical protein